MPFNLGGPELIIILVVVLIVFGAGRLPEVFGQLGKGVRTFREETTSAEKAAAAGSATSASTTATAAKHCQKCGNALSADTKFCGSCGAPVA